ncbi:uncharacterized protein At1g51745 [Coffea arabica]|uniref:Uncharacterized protein At1g51745 n=1 Tax=Coffea arabica TaxID=13443 RepID=A0A6P6XF68_COFAR
MGSDDEASNKGIDASVGGLVWVRRRNGSWWPGRILGPEELPESCLVSPKSGTPVKLLGREDASVDWYNLEKSKRVKAFRCGEYDDCIEKAKAAANSSKKVVKYARREDAILHALELENARLGKDHPDFCSTMDKKDEDPQDFGKSPNSLHSQEDTEDSEDQISSSEDESDSELELSHSGVSFEEPDHPNAGKEESAEGRQWRTPNDSEDDGTEGIKRMRGLEDLGMSVVSSLKRKRSQVAHVHEFLKRKNRRRPLTKVLESTVMVSVPVLCEQLGSPTRSYLPGVSDSKVSGIESNESKRSFSIANNNSDSTGVSCENGASFNASEHAYDASLMKCKQKENEISSILGYHENGSSDSLFDVPLMAEEKHSAVISCASQKPQIGAGAQSSQCSQVETMSLGNDELNESGSTSSGTGDMNTLNQMIEKGASEWQLKGKRNSRHTGKIRRQDSRYTDADEESDVYLTAMDQDVLSLGSGRKADCSSIGGCLALNSTYRLKSRTVTDIQLDEFGGWSSSHNECHVRDLTAELPQRSLPFRLSRFVLNPKYNQSDFSLRHHITDSSLYDVNVEVKASYRPHHVPYISLMSKLNGRPIIGHPLTVDVLEDGSCDQLVSSSECHSSSYELDDDPAEDTYPLRSFDMVYERRPNSGGRTNKHQALQPRVSPAKSPKAKKNGLLLKKIRKLSSLTGHKHCDVDKKPVMEKLKGPAVACVPLKVVFSRINAALNSSMRSTHRLLPPSNG